MQPTLDNPAETPSLLTESEGPPSYQIAFRSDKGVPPLEVVIALCEEDYAQIRQDWFARKHFTPALLRAEIYPAVERLLVSWNSRRVPYHPDKLWAYLGADKALSLLRLAALLQKDKEVTEGELFAARVTSIQKL